MRKKITPEEITMEQAMEVPMFFELHSDFPTDCDCNCDCDYNCNGKCNYDYDCDGKCGYSYGYDCDEDVPDSKFLKKKRAARRVARKYKKREMKRIGCVSEVKPYKKSKDFHKGRVFEKLERAKRIENLQKKEDLYWKKQYSFHFADNLVAAEETENNTEVSYAQFTKVMEELNDMKVKELMERIDNSPKMKWAHTELFEILIQLAFE